MGIEALLERLESGSGTSGTLGRIDEVQCKSLPVLDSTSGTYGTFQNKLTVNKIKPATKKISSQAEKLLELDLLVNFIAASNGFTKEDIFEAKKAACNDLEGALISFRELAKTTRQKKVIALLEENPKVSRTTYIDTESDPHNVILTIAVRNFTMREMMIDKEKYDPWRLITMMDSTYTPH